MNLVNPDFSLAAEPDEEDRLVVVARNFEFGRISLPI